MLDGFVMKQPCVAESGPRACRTAPPGACPANADALLAGARPVNETLTFGGRTGTLYDVTLRVQGVVESKVYENGSDASELPTNGFYRNGTVDNAKNQRSVFALRVASPPASYFFNALGREAMRHSVFAVDYEATLTLHGGTKLELWILRSELPGAQKLRRPGRRDRVPSGPHPEPRAQNPHHPRHRPISYNGQFLGFAVKTVVERK